VVFSGSSTNKTDRHDIAEVLLKVALNTNKQTTNKQQTNNKQTTNKQQTNNKHHVVVFMFTFFFY
jgi:hypothetical protein